MAVQETIGASRDIMACRSACQAWAATLDDMLRRSNALAKAYAGCVSADFQAMGYDQAASDYLVQFITALPSLPTTPVIQTALTYADKLRDLGR